MGTPLHWIAFNFFIVIAIALTCAFFNGGYTRLKFARRLSRAAAGSASPCSLELECCIFMANSRHWSSSPAI